MKNFSLLLVSIICLMSCSKSEPKKTIAKNPSTVLETKMYSDAVKDTFTISICLPKNYNGKKEKYPIVFLLDSNLYFDTMAATFKKYAETGLLDPMILVGIGYKDLETMDSLRQRDYTYPIAIPEYEMGTSGGADTFLSFISKELLPAMDKQYSIDKNKRVLMGHSLGAYFTLYALEKSLAHDDKLFDSYIAASPSTHYNHNYLLEQFNKLKADNHGKTKVYVTFGGLEDEEEDELGMLKTNQVLLSLNQSLHLNCKTLYKGESFSNLGHMDTQFPTFIKGLQWSLGRK